MYRSKSSSFHILIFLLCFSLTVMADEEETPETATENATENAPEDVTEATSSTDAPIDSTTEQATGNDTFDAAKCNKKNPECCGQLFLGKDDDLVKCFTLHQSKLPQEGEKDPSKLLKFLSCFIECQYKLHKYIGKGDNINMKMVRGDAEKSYPGRPKERDYYIEMFEFCRKDAAGMFTLIKMSPGGKVLLKDACKPYFTFVYLCNAEYHKKHRCPYFRWEGKRKTDSEEKCAEAKQRCYELDGITP